MPEYFGIMSFWGLAEIYNQSTLEWLQQRAGAAGQFKGSEAFAIDIGHQLNEILPKLGLRDPLQAGIGIHFTAFELIDGYRIPELFAITNFESPDYAALHQDGIHVTRETYGVAFQDPARPPEHGDTKHRHKVRTYLDSGNVLLYNNGDPRMFNSAAGAIQNLFGLAAQRGILKASADTRAHRDIVRWPIDLVANVQRNFVKDGYQLVGGARHTLSITSRGEYESDTGD